MLKKIAKYIRKFLGYETLEDIAQEHRKFLNDISGVPLSFKGSYVPKNHSNNKDI